MLGSPRSVHSYEGTHLCRTLTWTRLSAWKFSKIQTRGHDKICIDYIIFWNYVYLTHIYWVVIHIWKNLISVKRSKDLFVFVKWEDNILIDNLKWLAVHTLPRVGDEQTCISFLVVSDTNIGECLYTHWFLHPSCWLFCVKLSVRRIRDSKTLDLWSKTMRICT